MHSWGKLKFCFHLPLTKNVSFFNSEYNQQIKLILTILMTESPIEITEYVPVIIEYIIYIQYYLEITELLGQPLILII